MSTARPGKNPLVTALKREWSWILGNRWALFMVFGFPLIVLGLPALVFTPSIIVDIPVAVVDEDQSEISRQIIRKVAASGTVRLQDKALNLFEAEQSMRRGKIYAIIYIPFDTARNIHHDLGGTVFVYFNQAYYTVGSLAQRAIGSAVAAVNADLSGAAQSTLHAGQAPTSPSVPVKVQAITLFNPQLSFEQSLVSVIHPAVLHLLALCMMIYALGRELEALPDGWPANQPLLSSLVGKMLPYVLIYTAWGALSLIWLFAIRGYTLNGTLWIVVLAFGLMISAYAAIATVFVAGARSLDRALSMGSLFAGPALAYGDVLFPVAGASWFVRFWSLLMPYTVYMRLQLQQTQMGASLRDALPGLGALLLYLMVLIPLGYLMMRHLVIKPCHAKSAGKLAEAPSA